MDSINRQQPEENREDLSSQKALAKIRELVEGAKVCFFTTATSTGGSLSTRPMHVQQMDAQGHLWFLSASDSHKNRELALDPAVRLYFQGSAHSDFLALTGRAAVTTDKAKIGELWKPLLKTWFTGGLDDPRLTALEFTPHDGYYWDTKHGNTIAGLKILLGAALGKTLDDSIEGTLKP